MNLWHFNIRHLRALVAISRHGTLSRAARAVSLTQPAVTQAISKLERQFGLPLFVRRPDGMDATEAALILRPRIEKALSHIGSSRVTTTQMRALVLVAEAGSYSEASRKAGLTEASLHRALADLSVATGERLVERRGRGIMLTAKGLATARAYRLANVEIIAALSELDALKGYETGRIAIGAMPLSRAKLLPAAIALFHQRFPDVDIVVAEGSHNELVGPLRDGELDFMIGALRTPDAFNDLTQTHLFVDRPVILGRSGHPLTGTRPDAATLAGYPWIVAGPGAPLRAQWEEIFTHAGIAPPHVPIECGSVITIRQLLMTGDFLTLLSPDQVAVELEAGWLERVAPPPVAISRNIGVTTRLDWTPTPSQQAFMELLIEQATLHNTSQ
ncbi:LysR family transcriptional regulator [Pseudokordiimonas caeni]|uniref:LysR family transcriptional regulator n=1 Tax=Pseudokordiimonas caeni TaxID=2997908 RepID=UPI002811F0B1|nr:LysR family transcriptional regulator [Pseudokordiimonas caeni]